MLGRKSARHGEHWIVPPAFSITELSLCCFPNCCVQIFPDFSEASNFSHALCRALAHTTELEKNLRNTVYDVGGTPSVTKKGIWSQFV